MKVATYYNNQDIRVVEVPVPKIGAGELLIKTEAAGICGSDVVEWYRTKKVGSVLGHEIAGEIVGVGEGVLGHKKGDRVAASHHVPCYECHDCSLGNHTLCPTLKTTNFDPGGFAQFIRLPEINVRHGVYPLPASVSYEEGTFIEPLACVVRGQRKANVRPQQTLLVIGAGISGILHLLLAKAKGVARVMAADIQESRLQMARDYGADLVLHASEVTSKRLMDANEGRLPDVVVVCSGALTAIDQALQCAGEGGCVLFFALCDPDCVIPIPMNEIFWQKSLILMNSYAGSPEDHRESLEYISSGKIPVKKMITHRLSMDEIGLGFKLVAEARNSLKVLVNPNQAGRVLKDF